MKCKNSTLLASTPFPNSRLMFMLFAHYLVAAEDYTNFFMGMEMQTKQKKLLYFKNFFDVYFRGIKMHEEKKNSLLIFLVLRNHEMLGWMGNFPLKF